MKTEQIGKHFDKIAKDYDYWKNKADYYYSGIQKVLSGIIPPGSEVLDVGCGTGTLLNCVKPSLGVGIDYSSEMLKKAKQKFPDLLFLRADAQRMILGKKFQYIIMVDIIDHVPDVAKMISCVPDLLSENGQCILTSVNPFWEPIFWISERLSLKMPEGDHKFQSSSRIRKIVEDNNLEVVRHGRMMLIPKEIPLVSDFVNKIAPFLPVIKNLCSTWFIVIEHKHAEKKKGCVLKFSD